MTRRSLRPVRAVAAIRTCVGCRVRSVKSDLLRLVAEGDDIVPDPPARLPGRGAYLHPSQECFELARRRRAFPRALRLPGPLGADRLAGYLAGQGEEVLQASSGAATGTEAETAVLPGKRDQL